MHSGGWELTKWVSFIPSFLISTEFKGVPVSILHLGGIGEVEIKDHKKAESRKIVVTTEYFISFIFTEYLPC